MCGIIGTTNPRKDLAVFESAFENIFHRGPDNTNYIATEDFIFGHTRLAIIDLDERSNQPFAYEFENKKITVVFNGEIYNFLEIKGLLVVKGYSFNTTSDTEVLCAAYLEWGYKCFDYFQGMWAVALHDHFKDVILIARDRVGKKPLYYSLKDEELNFASSLWAVCKLSGEVEISNEGLQLYFALGFIPDHSTIVKGVHKLIPGRVLIFKKQEGKIKLKFEYSSTLNSVSNNKDIPLLIEESVKKRIITDVSIATLMSGGVDSTIITKLTKKHNKKSQAYFVDFDNKDLSEFYWANYLSKRNAVKLNRVFLSDNEIDEAFSSYADVYEEPFADYSGIPSIAIFKKVAQNFKVVITGDGGDELFYGYPHYFKKIILHSLIKVNKVFKIEKYFNKNIRLILSGGEENFEGNYLKNHAVITSFAFNYINKRFNDVLSKEKKFSKAIIQYDREFNNLPEKYLVKTDRASMYSAIEVRSPFLDEVLLSKVRKMPVWKIFTPKISKLYLKLTYFKIFGVKYLFSKKQGFVPPIQKLRDDYFKDVDFINLKKWIGINDTVLYSEIEFLTFEQLKKDPILFDRFFFFDIWLKKSKFEKYSKT